MHGSFIVTVGTLAANNFPAPAFIWPSENQDWKKPYCFDCTAVKHLHTVHTRTYVKYRKIGRMVYSIGLNGEKTLFLLANKYIFYSASKDTSWTDPIAPIELI